MLHGSRTPPRSRPRSARAVQQRVRWALPTLRAWAVEHESLREITLAHVLAALPLSGVLRATLGQAKTSLFRTLKGHKVTFTNPTAHITIGATLSNPPLPVDLNELRQALHSANPPRSALAALIAFHALPPRQVRLLLTDLRDGRLHLPERTILLADAVRQRLAAYLAQRARRWPNTANAGHVRPVHPDGVTDTLGMSAQAIMEGRILHEALVSDGDVRRICDLLGLSVSGAERYAAVLDHPDLRYANKLVIEGPDRPAQAKT